ncbi:ABC transporter ATP-binding protein [Geotalea sp. SG265]|uniref:ABC transporter ATP-binding protein n=1 Tax=Geotalea sp. SG265 TaxID=2922867 RepID=UPI001FAFB02A|nr:ABC transporter ATP-binding protein [Geotalea sp. SG265]
MLLEMIDVNKKFDDDTIIREVSLGVTAGQSVAVTGPSGSGKSTLMSIFGLLLQPSQGEVRFNGQPVSSLSDDERSRLRNRSFGFIFQNPQLIGSLSVLDNVLVPARLARRPNLDAAAKVTLESFGLGHRLKHLPHQLSIGQKRRVAIARALLLGPEVVFADEPTNDLDQELAGQIGEYLLSLPKSGSALVLVTHDHHLAAKADRTVRIDNGTIH